MKFEISELIYKLDYALRVFTLSQATERESISILQKR